MKMRLQKNIFLITTIMVVFFAMTAVFSYGSTASPYASGQINASSGAVLRKTSSTTSSKVAFLADNTKVRITKEIFKSKTKTSSKYKWYYVSVNGKKGYIRADLVDNVKYSAVSGKITGKVNYRSGAGTKMKRIGSLSKGTAVTIYLESKPVSSTKGSSSVWYKIKVGSKYRYVCSAYVDIVGSIFTNNTSTTSTTSTTAKTTAANEFAKMTDAQFDSYLDKQGFTSTYKIKLKELHKKHPSWVFVGKKTGIKWATALSKESANGVSLVEGSQPIAYRATDSSSYQAGTTYIYKGASTTTKLGTVKNFTDFTILDEVWKGTVRWNHVSLTDGTKGYIKGSLYTQDFTNIISGTVTADSLNVRKGAGTANSSTGSLTKGKTVSIVLRSKDNDTGKIWYKIQYGTSYGYVSSDYIKIDSVTETKTESTVVLSERYPIATITEKTEYRAFPNMSFPILGSIQAGSEITVVAKVVDAEGNSWLKLSNDGVIVYVRDKGIESNKKPNVEDIPASINGITNSTVNYRKEANTSGTAEGTIAKGKSLTVKAACKSDNKDWYVVDWADNQYYVCSTYVDLKCDEAPADSISQTVTKTLKNVYTPDISKLTGKGQVDGGGKWIPKDGSNWFNANKATVAYYMDPRNFLNEDRIYMFEDLSYQSAYQTSTVVSKVLSGSKLPGYGFSAKYFVDAGSIYNISPVFLAARARQETGGGSIAISGYKYNGKIVYNPFNIGAYSSANPVMNGMKYAYNHGWTTQYKAIKGGASFMASGYINAGQNSIYFQRFNVANGANKVATHQYMTNIQAPYGEAYSTKTSYSKFGITNEALTFIIPIYSEMPSSTSLPNA